MSDKEVRELERLFAKSRKPDDGERWVRALERAGKKPLELAKSRARVLEARLAGIVPGVSVLEVMDAGPVFSIEVAGKAAIPTWKKLRKLVKTIGAWPIVAGPKHEVGLLDPKDKTTTKKILAAAKKLEPLGGMDQDEDEVADLMEDLGLEEEEPEDDESDEPVLARKPRSKDFTIPTDILEKKPLPLVVILLLPTTEGAVAPALRRFGGWNECPRPERHVEVLRSWKKRFGAELVGMSRDVLELRVKRPPLTREGAHELACEQYAYCSDIVGQGTVTVARLARELRGNPYWFFWWD